MFLEERVESLEETIQKLQNEIRFLKKQSADEYLTPKEFAHRMKFSENTEKKKNRSEQLKEEFLASLREG